MGPATSSSPERHKAPRWWTPAPWPPLLHRCLPSASRWFGTGRSSRHGSCLRTPLILSLLPYFDGFGWISPHSQAKHELLKLYHSLHFTGELRQVDQGIERRSFPGPHKVLMLRTSSLLILQDPVQVHTLLPITNRCQAWPILHLTPPKWSKTMKFALRYLRKDAKGPYGRPRPSCWGVCRGNPSSSRYPRSPPAEMWSG